MSDSLNQYQKDLLEYSKLTENLNEDISKISKLLENIGKENNHPLCYWDFRRDPELNIALNIIEAVVFQGAIMKEIYKHPIFENWDDITHENRQAFLLNQCKAARDKCAENDENITTIKHIKKEKESKN
jgi:hypothetical protein